MTIPCLYCLKNIDDGLWCSMECKKLFLLDHYDAERTIKVMRDELIKRQSKKFKLQREIHESGLTASEYIMGGKDAFQEKSE